MLQGRASAIAGNKAARRFVAVLVAVAFLAPGAVDISIAPPAAADPGSVTFSYTGAAQTFVVPAGVEYVAVDVFGAQGAGVSHGGSGGRIQATLAVTPSQVLQVNVGGQGGAGGGFNGGSTVTFGGGGASDIRTGSYAVGDRLIVAGGGGGVAEGGSSIYGQGGSGGGATGGAGQSGLCSSGVPTAGGGGTSTAGGAGGIGTANGGAGTVGVGGTRADHARDGGGGGGGYFGGGGGGACGSSSGTGAGGGGGSSWAHATSATNVAMQPGVRRGHGTVTISWPPAAAPPVTPDPDSVAFAYTGGAQWWTVPAGVTAVAIDAFGAQGAGTSYGGSGGRVQATLSVAPGQLLQIHVGGNGGTAGNGFNGGTATATGGGGASDVRVGGVTLSDRVVVAGGGGGGAEYGTSVRGLGGSGGSSGGNGTLGECANGVEGSGATQTTGGAGGGNGTSGSLAQGGTRGGVAGQNSGGGGGGGYYGGGGGGSCSGASESGAGGGGGSSFAHATIVSEVTMDAGIRRGHGAVTITWPPAAPEPVEPDPGSETFAFTGATQWWTVPAGVNAVAIEALGAQGDITSWGGSGARVKATLAVAPGQLLQVNVGGMGGSTGSGFNGGYVNPNSGGGASDVRLGGITLTDRVLVAGGGGGAAENTSPVRGPGGSGGATGVAGTFGTCANAVAGGGASPSAGGAGGGNGAAGSFGQGGKRGHVSGHQSGGGGGGGYFGGGGGGSCSGSLDRGAGGGGGSSYTHPTLAAGASVQTGVRRGHGEVTISWPPTLPATPVPASGSASFSYTGGAQWWTVPDGVNAIAVEAIGAKGGATRGGSGGRVDAVIAVEAGQELQVNVGGHGGSPQDGYNGGTLTTWGGGGASDIRIGGVTLADRVVIAAGGGGAGMNASTAAGSGGAGGGLNGVTGQAGTCANGVAGSGASQSGGGVGGANGETGSLGQGGKRGTGAADQEGGGGGGGYYGGGGGGSCTSTLSTGGGGGGGSSYVKPEVTYEATTTTGANSGSGSVTITWPPPIDIESSFGWDSYGEYRNGVHIGSGNFVEMTTDVEIATVGPDLRLDRTYNSLDTRVGIFGRGWSTQYDMTASVDPVNGNVTIIYPDGRREKHTAQGGGVYRAPTGYVSTLTPLFGGGFRLTHKDKSKYDFHSVTGRLLHIEDAYGRALDLNYDGSNNLDTVVDAESGRLLDFTFTGSKVTSVSTTPVAIGSTTAPLTWNFGYADDFLERVCDARDNNLTTGNCTKYVYTDSRLTKITRPEGNDKVRVGYNATTGKAEWSENGEGERVEFEYFGGVTEITDARDFPTLIFFDHKFRTIRVTEVDFTSTTYEYDVNGFRSAVTDANGNRATMVYDERGNMLSTTNAEGETTWYEYSGDDQIAMRDGRSADASDNAYKTSTTYNAQGDKLTSTTPPAAPEYPSGITSTTTYSDGTENHGWGVIPPGLVLTQSPGKGTTTFEYDAKGDLIRRTDPSGLVTVFVYDALGRATLEVRVVGGIWLVTTRSYDQLGNVLTQAEPAVTDAVSATTSVHKAVTTHVYDGNSRVESTTVSDGGGTGPQTPSRTSEFTYDLADRLLTTTDAEGGETTSVYDDNGNVVRVTDAEGRVLETEYDVLDRKTELRLLNFVDDPVAATTPRTVVLQRWGYDATGRVVTESKPQPGTGGRSGQLDPDPDVTPMSRVRTTYDKADRVTAVTLENYDEADTTTRDIVLNAYVYDNAGNKTSETVAGLRTTTFEIDAMNRVQSTSTMVDGVARVVEFDYDELGNPTRTVTKPAGGAVIAQTDAVFDNAGRMTSKTVENGAVDLVTTYAYDERGLVTAVTDPRGNTTNTTYTPTGLVASVKLPQVEVEAVGGTPSNARPETKYGYDAVGNQVAMLDPRGNRTVTAYDKLNRRTLITHPSYTPPGGSALTPTEAFEYDAVGNLVERTDRRGYVTTFEFDKRNRVIRQTDPVVGAGPAGESRTAYDDAGNTVESIDPTGATVETAYDDLGRVRTRTQVVRQPSLAEFTTTFDYDDLGNQTFVQDPTGVVSTAAFNAASEKVSETDAFAKTTTYTYDAAGRSVSTQDPLGRTLVNVYDPAGRVTSVETRIGGPAGTLLTRDFSTYDGNGNLTQYRSARSASVSDDTYLRTYGYDAANRLTSVAEPDTGVSGTFTATFGYDAAGNQTRSTDGRGTTASVIHQYNAWNLRTVTKEPLAGGSDADRTFTTVYDAAGLVDRQEQPGATIDASFDALGRLTSEAGTGSGLTAASRSFEYDLAGRRTGVSHPTSPFKVTFAYDDRGLLLSSAAPGSSAASFVYDGAGRMTSRTDAAGITSFDYDGRGDLSLVSDPLTGADTVIGRNDARQVSQIAYGANGVRTFTYNDRGLLTTDVLMNGATQRASYTYAYDLDGNVTGQNIVLPSNGGAGNQQYQYDRAGRLVLWDKPSGTDVAYDYDAAGNRVTEGSGTFTYDLRNRVTNGPDGSYTWSARGTMTSGRRPNGSAISYEYDALGRQTKAASTTVVYDGLDRVIKRGSTNVLFAGAEIDPVAYGTELYSRTPAGELVAAKKGSAETFVGENRHGDITWYLNPNGTTWGGATYDPWGEPTENGNSTTLGYQGDLTDPTSGDVWMGARWYDVQSAGFTVRDTVYGQLKTPVTLNRYTYANNNPLLYFDPDGRRAYSYQRQSDEWYADRARENPAWRNRAATSGAARTSQQAQTTTQMATHARVSTSLDPDEMAIPTIYADQCHNGSCTFGLMWIGSEQYSLKELESVLRATVDSCSRHVRPVMHPDYVNACAYAAMLHAQVKQAWEDSKPKWYEGKLSFAGAVVGGGLCAAFGATALASGGCSMVGSAVGRGAESWLGGGDAGDALGAAFDRESLAWDAGFTFAGLGAARWLGYADDIARADDVLLTGDDIARTFDDLDGLATACSFGSGTPVLMADGTRKAISDVEIGDWILATDPETGETGPREVIATLPHEDQLFTLDTSAGEIVTTENHKYWNATDHQWQEIQDFDSFDRLLSSDGTVVIVQRLDRSETHKSDAYDLDVAGIDTYYVGVRDDNVLVHNCDVFPTPNVADPKLQNYVDNLYKGTTNPSRVGTGTTADAVRNEILTGQPTGGTFHLIKAQETVAGLERWLKNNPGASYSDRLVAQSLLDELKSALGGTP